MDHLQRPPSAPPDSTPCPNTLLEEPHPDPGSIICPPTQSRSLLPHGCSSSHTPRVPLSCRGGLWVQSTFSLGFLSRTQPGLSKSCRGAFRSPRPSAKCDQADAASEDSLHLDIQRLKEKRDMLDKELSQFISEGYSVDELEDHIAQLHEYNDIKDVGQMLLGKLAVIRGVTTKELYPEFGLDMDD
ncbi:DNA repair protein SWI5 homolog [Phacochoerus africanus]|uniref:DNA repair protein SWI5 homolog n=1 Tax=Phacochoerus africanus TaxID=41426 RepID=UPI001FDA6F9B|nr:DNA repair protein SWI5 homolog [Phacochoerus africanus]